MPESLSETHQQEPLPRPPIMQRSATFFGSLDERRFEQSFEKWGVAISEDFPDPQVEPRYRFELDGVDPTGLPKLKNTIPSLWFDYRHDKTLESGKGFNSSRVFPGDNGSAGGVTFYVGRNSEQAPRAYTELAHMNQKWLPHFGHLFAVDLFTGVLLSYSNVIKASLFPEFRTSQGGLNLGQILKVHEALKMPGKGFMLPYKHKMTLKGHETRPIQVTVSVEALPIQDSPEVELEVDFDVHALPSHGSTAYSTEAALKAVDECHEIILDFFRATFTDEALELFNGKPNEAETLNTDAYP